MSPTPPHILYVGAQLPKLSETFVYREVLGLRQRGIEVSIASVNPPPPDDALGDPVLAQLAAEAFPVYGKGRRAKLAVYRDAARQAWVRLPKGLTEVPKTYWPKYVFQWEAGHALAYRVRDQGITHVHAHMAHVPATVALSCAEALGVPFSFTGHAADLFRDRMALKTKLERAAFVACISRWHRAFYQDIVPLPDERLPVIRCGVDIEAFSPAQRDDRAEAANVLAVGRLVMKKGFDVLIRAMAAVPAARLTLVGEGPEESALRAVALEAGVADRVDFLGAQPNAAVRELMGRADVFALPCREAADGDRDGIPVVLMEAMARGVCVVSGDLPTIRELVTDNHSGVMVRPGSVDELSGALIRLLGDGGLRDRLAAAGRSRVAQEFSSSVNLDRLEAAFASSLGSSVEEVLGPDTAERAT